MSSGFKKKEPRYLCLSETKPHTRTKCVPRFPPEYHISYRWDHYLVCNGYGDVIYIHKHHIWNTVYTSLRCESYLVQPTGKRCSQTPPLRPKLNIRASHPLRSSVNYAQQWNSRRRPRRTRTISSTIEGSLTNLEIQAYPRLRIQFSNIKDIIQFFSHTPRLE
jgi:hypothetical protein